MTLDIADLLAIAGVVFGPLLLIGGGALAWLRADIRNLRADLSDLRTESHTGISGLRTDTQAALNDLRTDTQAALNDLRTDTQAALNDLRTETQAALNDLRTETQAALNDLRTEIRATNARLDTLTQIILTSALAHGQPTAPPEAVPRTEAPRQPTPA